MAVKRAVVAGNESSPERRNTVADSFAGGEKVMSDQDRGFYEKWKAFGGDIEADQESTCSSEDMESPRSVVAKVRKWPAINKNVNLYVHSQVLRIREEDSLIGEDVAENLNTEKSNDRRYRNVDLLILSHKPILPASPLSGKAIKSRGH